MVYNSLNTEVEAFTEQCIPDFTMFLEKLSMILPGSYSLYLIDDAGIQKLNRQYRNIDKVTDVLSFPMDLKTIIHDDEEELFLGEIIVNPYEIKRKAEADNESYKDLCAYMIIHSYLHLKGYTHATEDEYRQMESISEDMLRRFAAL